MVHPGSHARIVNRLLRGLLLILLTILGFVSGLPLLHGTAGVANGQVDSAGASSTAGYNGTVPIRQQGADRIPSLSFPKTVVSSVNNLVGAGGVISNSPQNLTLYNSAISMRLLGTPTPHDVLLGDGGRILSSYSFWYAQLWLNGSWISLIPSTNSFALLGTNKTGTFVVRTMQVEGANHSGVLKIAYKATTTGPLNWDLDFTPAISGQYRLVHLWQNITSYQLLVNLKQFRAVLGNQNYTFDWSDVSAAYVTAANATSGAFSFTLNIGNLTGGSETLVDPSIVGTSTSTFATAWTFQRKLFFEPRGGYYFAFYYNGSTVSYRYSHDGVNWSLDQPMPTNWPTYLDNATSSPSIFYSNQHVIIATGSKNTTTTSAFVSLRYSIGNITGHTISWGKVLAAATISRTAASGTIVLGIRFVSVTADSGNILAFSFNWYTSGVGSNTCIIGGANDSSESGVYVAYDHHLVQSQCTYIGSGLDAQQDRSVVVPSGIQKVRVIYQFGAPLGNRVSLDSQTIYSDSSSGAIQNVDSSSVDSDEFSAVPDSNYGTNLVYRSSVDYNITYAYEPPADSSWSHLETVLPPTLTPSYSYPTITLDYSTNELYIFGADPQNQQVVIRTRTAAGIWENGLSSFPAGYGVGPFFLGSGFVSASASNSTTVFLTWTIGGQGLWSVEFASIPIIDVWSPYASPPDPWDGNGIAPYAQYFSNLGESVSPSSGMLTVEQTDLGVPGRGMTLDFTRVYTEPYRFLGSFPYGYENYPWAPMGNDWQLNFPWIASSANDTYIHLWSGQGYVIPSMFWAGQTATYDNHDGVNFHLARHSDGSIVLQSSDGSSYNFDPSHKLANITDTTGHNLIQFSYDNNSHISKAIDTIGRVFLFCYTNGLLHSINQTSSSSCSTGVGSVRGVVFGYNVHNDLVNATDPAGRVTAYSYDSTNWLITKITYPTSWYDTYSYTSFSSGTQVTIYRVNWQKVNATNGSPQRSFKYTYAPGPAGQVNNSTVATYDRNGNQPASYTSYVFSFAGAGWNITDSNHGLVRGKQQHFNVHGQVMSDTIIVTDRSGLNYPPGSYTNYYGYDLWGNQIYNRDTILITANAFSNWSHESFSSYYNNGLPPGFNSFQETFSSNQGTASDNAWNVTKGYWLVNNGVYNGTETSGQQESIFARSDLGRGDLSVQAQVYVTKQINASDARVGTFVHNPTSTIYKWMLVLHNRTIAEGGTGTATYLDLSDELYGSWAIMGTSGVVACPIVYNQWWSFTITVHGQNVTGAATHPGQTTPCIVSRTFSSSSPAISGTGFGLYGGGYSALFDNVTVTTVTPFITGTGFSNSFISGGVPSSSIHSAVAGSAELQNGTATVPIEAYYSYYSWGGLNQTISGHGMPLGTGDSYNALTGGQLKTIGPPGSGYPQILAQPFINGPTTGSLFQVSFTLTSERSTGPLYVELWSNSTGPSLMLSKSNPIDASTVTIWPNVMNYTFAFKEPLYTLGPGTKYYVAIDGGKVSCSCIAVLYNGVNAKGTVYSWSTNSGWSSQNSITTSFFVTTESWLTTSRYYDQYGNLLNIFDPMGNSTSYGYSSKYQSAFMTNMTHLLYQCDCVLVSSFGYNITTGSMTWSQEPNGYGTTQYNTTYRYDILGRLTRTTYPNGDFTSYSYNDRANYVDVTNENGWHSRQVYDGLGRLSVSESFLGSSTINQTYAYNWQDKIVTQTDPLGHTYSYQYDSLGRLTQTTEPNGNFTQILYNDVRGWVRHIDELIAGPSSWTFYSYDRMGRLIEVDDPPTATSGVNSALYYYDEVGNLRMTCRGSSQFSCGYPGSQQTFYTYDSTNRLAKTLYPDNSTELYVYDNNGNFVQRTDRNGVQTNEFYDSLNRPTTTTYQGAQPSNTTYSYDKNGKLIEMINPNTTISYVYDSRNRIVQEGYYAIVSSNNALYAVNFTYKGETLSQILYPDNLRVNYTYDALGRVTSVFTPGGTSNYATLYYLSMNQVKSVTYGNSLYANYTYDRMSRPSTITVRKGTNTLLSLSYSYNKTGTVTSVNGQVNGTTDNEQYVYDNLQRLTNATLTTGNTQRTLSYQYDSIGNRVWQKQNGLVTTYSYNNANNELLSSASGATTAAYSYDRNGGPLTKNATLGGITHWVYKWDVPGHLTKVSNGNGVQGIYAYDADGRLVGSKEGSTISFYAYLSTETLYQLIGTSSTDYIFAGGTRIAKVIATTISYYHADTEGNTRLVTSSTGSVLFADNYLPFGQDNGTPPGSETYKFIGKPWSSAIGLYYDYQRWYDPSIGRFISTDPASGDLSRPQSLNQYAYGFNNPIAYVDSGGSSPLNTFIKALFGLSFFLWSEVERFSEGGFASSDFTWGSRHFMINPIDEYKDSSHVIWEGRTDVWDKTRLKGELISKLDRPSEYQPFYHLRVDVGEHSYHLELPEQVGGFSTGMLDALFDHPALSGGIFFGIGLGLSAYDVWSAYQQGTVQGNRELTSQVFSWGGAIGGAEVGALIGTEVCPGICTVAGALVFGALGAVGMGYVGDWVANQLFTTGGNNAPGWVYYPTPDYGKGRMVPM